MTDENSTTGTGPAPPTPNPMHGGFNPYPRPETGTNWALARATREFIASIPARRADNTAHDDGQAWVQQDWRCATGMCYAGWASALTGAKFLYAADNEDRVDVDFAFYAMLDMNSTEEGLRPGTIAANHVVEDADGKTWHVQAYARHMLGLTYRSASRLFAGSNDLISIDNRLSRINDDGMSFDLGYDTEPA
jgi:hypothetical protein